MTGEGGLERDRGSNKVTEREPEIQGMRSRGAAHLDAVVRGALRPVLAGHGLEAVQAQAPVVVEAHHLGVLRDSCPLSHRKAVGVAGVRAPRWRGAGGAWCAGGAWRWRCGGGSAR